MENKYQNLANSFKGDLAASQDILNLYSHDASLFEIKPELVAFPKDSKDVCTLVNYVNEHKAKEPGLSLTPRSGGTCMSGGAVNDSIIVAFERYFNNIGEVENNRVNVQPGVYYRDLEPKTLAQGLLLPSYPASREICMVGGMVSNNSGGEKSLIYGKTERYLESIKMVLADGKEHTFNTLDKVELEQKLAEPGYEGDLYREVWQIIQDNQQLIQDAKPKVSKNSTGYNIWDVWDGTHFRMHKLFVGAQGTLGLMTEAEFSLVKAKPLSGMLVVFMPTLKNLAQIINVLLPLKPSSLESFDDHTLKFAFRFFYNFHQTLGWRKFIFLGMSLLPVLNKILRFLPHFPKMIMLVEFEGENQKEIDEKIATVQQVLEPFDVETQLAKDKHHEEKFWTIRRESFNLLRKNVKHKHTAPFIDDVVVPPANLPEFLPKLIEICERYKLLYTIAGHMGDGNFHIIPLMDLSLEKERQKIPVVLKEVTDLVVKYGGSLSGEHNDGLIRGHVLNKMYSEPMMNIFQKIKTIFDPNNIFNPHKKMDAKWEYAEEHIRRGF